MLEADLDGNGAIDYQDYDYVCDNHGYNDHDHDLGVEPDAGGRPGREWNNRVSRVS